MCGVHLQSLCWIFWSGFALLVVALALIVDCGSVLHVRDMCDSVCVCLCKKCMRERVHVYMCRIDEYNQGHIESVCPWYNSTQNYM